MKNYKDIKGGILKYYDIYFWNEFDKFVHELTPKNRKLLEVREKLQKQIDEWHKKQKRKKIDIKKYENFLKNIGYLV